jgi:pre-mRNA-processing factor 40
MRATINDERYKVLKTLQERKQAFADFQQAKRRQEAEERRRNEEKAREQFMQMLRECGQVSTRSSWRKVAPLFEKDPRFQAIAEEEEREDIFEDYIWELEKCEREAERELKRKSLEQYRVLLQETVRDSRVRWRDFKEAQQDDLRFKAVDKLDRLRLFEEHQRSLERREADERRQERERQRRTSRRARDAFRQLLRERAQAGEITLQSRWKDVRASLEATDAYRALLADDYVGSTPRQLFQDLLDDLEEAYRRDKKRLKRLLEERGASCNTTDPEQLLAALGPDATAGIPRLHFELFAAQQREKAAERLRSSLRRRLRHAERWAEQLPAEQLAQLAAATAPPAGLPPELANPPGLADCTDEEQRRALWDAVRKAAERERERRERHRHDAAHSSEEEGAVREEKRHRSSSSSSSKRASGSHSSDEDEERSSRRRHHHSSPSRDVDRKRSATEKSDEPERESKRRKEPTAAAEEADTK